MRNEEEDFQTSDVITKALYVGDHFDEDAARSKEGKMKHAGGGDLLNF